MYLLKVMYCSSRTLDIARALGSAGSINLCNAVNKMLCYVLFEATPVDRQPHSYRNAATYYPLLWVKATPWSEEMILPSVQLIHRVV